MTPAKQNTTPASVRNGGLKRMNGGGAALAAAALAAAALIAPWEGKRNDPYLDIVKVRTVCYGETRVAMRRYSDAECATMLQAAVTDDFAPPVFACTPALADPRRRNQAAAAISLAYNVGTAAWCRSTADRLFDRGDFAGGCRALGRFVKAGGRVVQGLVNRRRAEVALCLQGLTS